MNKEEFEFVTPNLAVIGTVMQDRFDEGFRVVDGYPMPSQWQYVVRMERNVPDVEAVVEAPKKLGRPANKSA